MELEGKREGVLTRWQRIIRPLVDLLSKIIDVVASVVVFRTGVRVPIGVGRGVRFRPMHFFLGEEPEIATVPGIQFMEVKMHHAGDCFAREVRSFICFNEDVAVLGAGLGSHQFPLVS